MTQPAGLPNDFANPPPLRRARAWMNVALFLLACAAGCALLGRLAPFPEVPGIHPKWAWLREHRDEIDVLFIGSSRFFHQVIPQQFDAAVAGAGGTPVRTFNFGYDGMWPPESFYLLRRILALRPARLQWVVIDLIDITSELDERNSSTMRMAYWHDLPHTLMAFADIRAGRQPWSRQAALFTAHGRLFISEALNVGRGAALVDSRLTPRSPRKKPYSWVEHAGYATEAERPLPAKSRAELTAAVARLSRGIPPAPVRPLLHEALRHIIAEVRRAGAEPIFVIAPTLKPSENFTGMPDGATLWAFNDPRQHPALFDPALRYDAWHLNHAGAVEFTALLAERFIEHTRVSR